jgi:hypothetical protein
MLLRRHPCPSAEIQSSAAAVADVSASFHTLRLGVAYSF